MSSAALPADAAPSHADGRDAARADGRCGRSARHVLTVALAAVAAACASSRSNLPPAVPASEASTRATTATAAEPAEPASVQLAAPAGATGSQIGADDLLDIKVLEDPELNRTARVSGAGFISLPLLGEVRAAGRTPRELEVAIEEQLSQRYIRSPHVSVHVSEMQGHAVSVVGAVAKPGVFQLREPRSLLEVIALAGGLAKEAGESVTVVRGTRASAGTAASAAPAAPTSVEISLRSLLNSGDPRENIPIYPGDLVKVKQAGLVYVVGEVRRPGAFPLEPRSGLTVLQAIALGEGLAPKASKGRVTVIRTTDAGARRELRVDLGDVVAGRRADLTLEPRDVVFVPSSAAKTVGLGAVDALVRMVTLRGVF